MLFLALVGVEGDAAAAVGGGFLLDVTLRALNDAPGRGGTVLGSHAHGLEAGVVHGQDAAGVDAALHVGGVVHLIRLAHDVADVVHAQIHQGTARTGRVEHRGRFSGAESVVPAGILAEIALHQPDRAHPGQQLPDLGVIFQILGGDGLKQEHLFVACQCHQLFRLCRAGSQRLFHNDVFPGLQRHPRKADVLQVGHGNVHHIHPLQQLQIVGGVLRHAILSAQLLCLFGAAGRAAQCLHRKRRVFHEPRQKFLHDLARAKNAHFHVVLPILSLIVSQPTSASGSRRVRFLL